MTPPPRCSVIVPTYNRVDLLRYTLDSLVRQSLPRDAFEVLVVDDGSSDGTADLVASYRDRLDLGYFFQEDRGYRVAKARNTGLRHARGPVSVFVDSGMILHSRALAAHCAAHEAVTGPVAVCGYVHGFNETSENGEQIARSIDYDDPDATIDAFTEHEQWQDVREWYYDHYGDELFRLAAPWLMFWTCNVSANTAQVKAVGMFDEAYRTWGGEDIDLAYRLHEDGARFVLRRDATSIHCPHPKEDMRSADANHRYFAAKYDTPITRLVPDTDIFLVEQAIRDGGLPTCAEHRAAQRRDRAGAA
ncbi:glycosyltransferase [Streptomyces sp. NPDC048845]|uniref:glycosyltransferase n=1 Tax=Streptomyces sp. NPDC048845 TaxID=3155390 RepID=UPI00341BCD38